MRLDKGIAAKYMAMNNTELEDELEHMNDAANSGEGFENYLIRE